jgi:hypothetical protein
MTLRRFASAEDREKIGHGVRDLNSILRERTVVNVKPRAAKVAPVRITPKHAEEPIEHTARRVNAVRVAIGAKKRDGL